MYKENIQRYLIKHGFDTFTPKAVLFDMDGVIYDSMPAHAYAWNKAILKSATIIQYTIKGRFMNR